ncbi:MAG TPA: hypothetical protein VK859_16895, partial [bacterium]|nr:hypothetical protein [bacterium]
TPSSTASITPTVTATATCWVNLGKADFSTGQATLTSLYVYNGSAAYVGYSDATSKAVVVEYNGSSWVTVGSPDFSTELQNLSLSVDSSSGTPYLAYEDDNTALGYVYEDISGTWTELGGAAFSTAGAGWPSLAIANGAPYVAFEDYNDSEHASVMAYSGGSWGYVGGEGFTSVVSAFTSLSVYNNSLYVAYEYGTGGGAGVMECSGCVTASGSWTTVGTAEFYTKEATNLSLFVDSGSGTPYLAFEDYSNDEEAMVMKYTGSSWVTLGNADFSAGIAANISLFVYNGTPYVAYGDGNVGGNATVEECSGCSAGTGIWTDVCKADFSPGNAVNTSLFIYSGTPYVAFSDNANSNKASVMYYP